jgi:pyridoxamine 5'-phosphate oxidase
VTRGQHAPAWDGSDPLPPDPLPVLAAWLGEAFAAGLAPNPHAVALATLEPDGSPAVRMVLCKSIEPAVGRLTFYTHRESAKGRALALHPRAALCFYWGPQDRQARVVGPVEAVPDAEADAYFASRPLDARLGAWASRQSEPIASRAALRERVREAAARFGLGPTPEPGAFVPRPPHWGGYAVLAESVELWISGVARLHDRAHWRRDLSDPARPGAWRAERLQP